MKKAPKTKAPKLRQNKSASAGAAEHGSNIVGTNPGIGCAEPLPLTQVVASIDVGFGNAIFIRGSGAGLSWLKGERLTCIAPGQWTWSTDRASEKTQIKLLLNDELWAQGDDIVIEPLRKIELTPRF